MMSHNSSTSTSESEIFSDKDDHVLSSWLSNQGNLQNVKNIERKLERWREDLENEFERKRNEISREQNQLLASIMEKQTESVERIAEKIQWIDEETSRKDDQNEFEMQAREIDKRLKILEAYEPVEYRLRRLEESMSCFSDLNEDVDVPKHDDGSIEDIKSVQEATNILRNLRQQVQSSVHMLETYLERAEEMTKKAHNSKHHEQSSDAFLLESSRRFVKEMEIRHAIDNRRLAGKYVTLEKRISDLESEVMEEQKSSLQSLRVLLKTMRKET